MRASVIVVTYNSASYILACLASISAQLGPMDELIVVDNSSTDDTVALIQQHCAGVRLIQGPNDGYAGGNNRGAAHARGDYLVFLNPDTVLEQDALQQLIAPLQRASPWALTTARIVLLHDPEVVNTCGNTVHYTGLAYCRGAGELRAAYNTRAEVDAVSGAAFAIRRTVWEQLGGFDQHFFMYVEDTDLSWRARLAGYRCLYVPEAVVQHAYTPTYSPGKAFWLDRNRHLMLLQNLARATYLRLLPSLLLSELVTGGFLVAQGPAYWLVKPRVYRAVWRHRHIVRVARQRVHTMRRLDDRLVLAPLTHRLAFGQLANRWLALLATLLFHPWFWLARHLLRVNVYQRAKVI